MRRVPVSRPLQEVNLHVPRKRLFRVICYHSNIPLLLHYIDSVCKPLSSQVRNAVTILLIALKMCHHQHKAHGMM